MSAEDSSEACATPRAPPTDRPDPAPKRVCAVPVLKQRLPLTFALQSNHHTGAGKSTADLKTVHGTDSERALRLAAMTEVNGVINRVDVDIRDPIVAAKLLRLIADD